MSERLLTDVEQVNFTILCLIRDTARADIADAATRFQLSVPELQLLCGMGPDKVLALVYAAGNELLFQPRCNLCGLLAAPAPILGVMLCAQQNAAFPAVAAAS